jgi:6-phosphogluconolactonase
VLPFSISTSGSLTALTPAAGPANSGGIANLGFFLMFADPAGNAVDSAQVNGSGTLTTVAGSPFRVGTAAGGPTSILAAPYGFFYATEPNGTIVGFTTPSNGTLTAAVPNSPFPAGSAPSQMAVVTLAASAPAPNALYASDAAPGGGILAYTINSAGSLTPVAGSPFPTLPNTSAGPVLVSSLYVFVCLTSLTSLTDFGHVAAFAIDLNTGGLTPVPGSPFAVGTSPGTLAEDSDNHLFVMNAGDHTVSAFSIGSNGVLTAIGAPVAAGTATGGIALLPPYLYVADTNASSILTLHIDATTGALTPAGSMMVASPPLQLTVVIFPVI